MQRIFASRAGLVLSVVAFSLVVFVLLRLVLLLQVYGQIDHGPVSLLAIFGVGFAHDLVVSLLAFAPVLLITTLLPERMYRTLAHPMVVYPLVFAVLSALIFVAVAEWLFWDEFGARANFIAVDYLVYRREVTGNIQESYNLPLLFTVIFSTAVVGVLLLRRFLDRARNAAGSGRSRLLAAVIAVTAFAGALAFDGEALANFSRNTWAIELSRNGVYQFFHAFRHNELDYDTFYVREDVHLLDRLLREEVQGPYDRFLSDAPLDVTRAVDNPGPEKHLNVMLVVVESLSGDYLATFGNTEKITPNLDRLVSESMFFDNFYALGNRTVRGLEAITLSLPPTPGSAIVRRPDNAHMFSLGTVFGSKGYDVRFLYGGYGYFDNMNTFFGGNGFDVIDRPLLTEDESEFATAWGVADEYIFKRAAREADRSYAAGKPFFSLVMTTSNHRPYDIPPGRINEPTGHPHLKAVQYTDWAINKLIEDARSKPWFDDTVFVIVADHCAGSAGKTALPLERYHIPMWIYSPKHIAPQRVTQLASQMDLAPTVLAQLGFDYTSRFVGRDIFTTPPERRRALMATYQRMGYFANDKLVILSPQNRVDEVTKSGGDFETPVSVPDDAVRRAIAYYQGASYRYHYRLDRDSELAAPAMSVRLAARPANLREQQPVQRTQ